METLEKLKTLDMWTLSAEDSHARTSVLPDQVKVSGGGRSGLWGEMFRICRAVRPLYILPENSSMLTVRGLERILCDLSEIGYNVEWQCLSGFTFGVQQSRERIYIIAYSNNLRPQGGEPETIFSKRILQREFQGIHPGWRTRRDIPEPRTFRSTNDLPDLMDRTKAIGNAIMPVAAKYLFECIKVHYNNFLESKS